MGRHIGGNDKLALEYFNNFVEATSDDGVSVRKRALQILWDSCIRWVWATDAGSLIILIGFKDMLKCILCPHRPKALPVVGI